MPLLIAQIRSRLSLVDVVTGYGVVLHPRGRRAVGLCPFHTERTASFTVYIDQQTYHCYGCGAHGDLIDFVARIEHLSGRDAIRQLAARAGITLVPPAAHSTIPSAPPPLLAIDAVPSESDLRWIRSARKAVFDRLVLMLCAVTQRIRVAITQNGTDADWERLHAAYTQHDTVMAEITAFWQQPGFLPLGDFLTRYLDTDAAYGGGRGPMDMPLEEFAVHKLRPSVVPDAHGGAVEWLDWLQPPPAPLLQFVRETMRQPLQRAEIDEVLEQRHQLEEDGQQLRVAQHQSPTCDRIVVNAEDVVTAAPTPQSASSGRSS